MNTKGFLLAEETLKIILGVIAVGLLAYLLFALYNANSISRELEFAQQSVALLGQGLEDELIEIEIYNPEGWVISSWPYDGEIPLTCSNLGLNNCICICNGDSLNKCNDASACVVNLLNLEVERKIIQDKNYLDPYIWFGESIGIEIKSPPLMLNIDYGNKLISKKN